MGTRSKGRLVVVGVLAAAAVWVGLAMAQTGWRTDATGRFPQANPPLTWSEKDNLVWKTPLGAWSNASPVLHRKRIFVCEEPFTLVCLDQDTGKVLWRAPLSYADVLPPEEARKMGHLPPTHGTNGYSSPTPVALGKRVYVLFGSGVAACYDIDGKRVWARFVAKSVDGWGHSASPVLAGDRLVLHIASTVHGLDAATGQTVWQATSVTHWGTPLLLRFGQDTAVLTCGGDIVRCSDGKVVARGLGSMPWTSPVVSEGVIYIVDEGGAFAFKLPETLTDPLPVAPLWNQPQVKRDRYYASPVVDNGLVYAVTQGGYLTVLDTKTGHVALQKQLSLGATVYPSVSLAGGRLYLSAENGRTVVLEPGREGKELASFTVEAFRTNPAFEGTRVYLRTLSALVCFGT